MTRSVLLVTATLISASVSFGFGYYDSMTSGTPIPGISPVSVALGASKAIGISEALSLFTNPAMTAELPFALQGTFSGISWSEKVIESDIDKTVRTLTNFGNFAAAMVYPLGPVSIGAGYAKVAEFGYQGTHTVFDNPDDPPLGVELLNVSGGQWEAMGSVSMAVTGPLSAGFSGGMRSASADYEYSFNSHRYSIPDSSSEWSLDQSEFAWHAGIHLDGELFKSGICYSSGTEYMEETVSMGFSAFAEHLKSITVGFEGELISPFDSNHFLGKLSIIMPLTENLNALTSASFDDQRIANRAGFGFGIGFIGHVDRFDMEVGVFNRFKARKDTAFPNESADRVDDSVTQFSFGVGYSFTN